MTGYNYTKRSVCTLFMKEVVTITLKEIPFKEVSALCMTGYNYTKRSVPLSSWLVTITLKEVSGYNLFMAGYNYPKNYTKCSLSSWLVTITLKEVSTLFMAGYNYTKRSVHSLHGWLQLH